MPILGGDSPPQNMKSLPEAMARPPTQLCTPSLLPSLKGKGGGKASRRGYGTTTRAGWVTVLYEREDSLRLSLAMLTRLRGDEQLS